MLTARPTFTDTSPEAQELLYEKLRALTPEMRLRQMLGLCAFGRKMMLAGIKERSPNASETELQHQFVKLVCGEEYANKYFGFHES